LISWGMLNLPETIIGYSIRLTLFSIFVVGILWMENKTKHHAKHKNN